MAWKKIAALGCLGTFVLCSGGVAAMFFGVTGLLRSSEVYKTSLHAARSNPAITGALGEPVEPGLMVNGSFSTSGSTGEADMAIPIHGPDGKATVYVRATKRMGRWEYEAIEVQIKNGDRIDITSDLH